MGAHTNAERRKRQAATAFLLGNRRHSFMGGSCFYSYPACAFFYEQDMKLYEIFFGLFVFGVLLLGILAGHSACGCGDVPPPEPIIITAPAI
jgi:hypothetical protein